METNEKRIVEINGVKLEVDMRTAKVVEQYKVGDPVKILYKENSYGSYQIYPGVIVGFADFTKQPAIELLMLSGSFSIKFVTITEKSENIEIAPFNDYEIGFSRSEVLNKIQNQIESKKEELRTLETKKQAFEKFFDKAFVNEMVS